jgi:hypothetical protein
MCSESAFKEDDIFGDEFVESEEIVRLDRFLDETAKIQRSLEAISIQCANLSSKYEESANNYHYDFSPSKMRDRGCVRSEYMLYTIWLQHLNKLCLKPPYFSPQRTQRMRRLTYVSSLSNSSSPSTSSSECLQHTDDETPMYEKEADEKIGYRSRRELQDLYARMKTEKIKGSREIEAALTSLNRKLEQSASQAAKANNYMWIKEKPRYKIRNARDIINCRRSLSTSMCRAKQSTPISKKQPLSVSVMF